MEDSGEEPQDPNQDKDAVPQPEDHKELEKLLLQDTGIHHTYFLIDDVVPQDTDGVLQFLVASPPPPR